MEVKFLSDQLNSVCEDFGLPQANGFPLHQGSSLEPEFWGFRSGSGTRSEFSSSRFPNGSGTRSEFSSSQEFWGFPNGSGTRSEFSSSQGMGIQDSIRKLDKQFDSTDEPQVELEVVEDGETETEVVEDGETETEEPWTIRGHFCECNFENRPEEQSPILSGKRSGE
eukprot:GHVP01010619.1.p2 GENE.GHVP01010619.1~~GHVP01010619.1.p2  ORF type:complete len:167 (+),score=31.88 GHVP01010619.1:36-536(+)